MHDDQTMRDMLELMRGRYFGKYRGLAALPIPDPTQRGRIQVQVPAVLGPVVVWAMPCVPYAGKNVGMQCYRQRVPACGSSSRPATRLIRSGPAATGGGLVGAVIPK